MKERRDKARTAEVKRRKGGRDKTREKERQRKERKGNKGGEERRT